MFLSLAAERVRFKSVQSVGSVGDPGTAADVSLGVHVRRSHLLPIQTCDGDGGVFTADVLRSTVATVTAVVDAVGDTSAERRSPQNRK